ncbi:ATP-dependent DNA helicase [Trichonephila clavipes]|nr:ATP-dependent DNA helicase [Trichonephila clavipes]
MISAQLLLKIDSRLKQITGNFQSNVGTLDSILTDLRQLPPVRSTPIYKQQKQTIVGQILWQNLNFYELNEVMRQANQQFSSILTKIGNAVRKTSHNCLDDSLKWRAVGILEAGESQAVVGRSVHVTRKSSSSCGNNFKQRWTEASQLFSDLAAVSERISRQTVYHLAETVLYSRCPVLCIPLNVSNKKDRA